MELAKRIWDFSTSQDLLRPGDRLVLGVSGGPDSLCLLDVLAGLAGRHRLVLHVAHLNHRLRPEADTEAGFVEAQAEARGCGFIGARRDVGAIAEAGKQSIETAAREARYAFLGRAARQVGARLVAVAHTADDQAETVLMHLLRGSGLRGLRGMLPKRVFGDTIGPGDPLAGPETAPIEPSEPGAAERGPLYLIRPLLGITRAEVMEYCAENKLAPRFDASNAEARYFRNRVRHELLPALEQYNPKLRSALARLGATAAGDYEIWLEAVHGLWQATVRDRAGQEGQVAFDRRRWLALSRAERRALLRLAIEHLAGDLDELAFAPLDAAADFSVRAAPGRSGRVLPGLVLKIELNQVTLISQKAVPTWTDLPTVVGDRLRPGWQLVSERLRPGEWTLEAVAAATRWTAHLDAGRLPGPLALRARRPGDRFQPLGLGGHTVKLSDYMVNRKIPVEQRQQWPLVTYGDEIVWVVGLQVSEAYKVSETTGTVWRLSVQRSSLE